MMSDASASVEQLDFNRHLVRLRFTSPSRFSHFLHGGALHGLLGHALEDRQLPTGLIPTAPESGRIEYDAGDTYHLGLTLVGEVRRDLGRIERGLRRIGRESAPAPNVAFGGNFDVEAVESLPPVDVDAEVSAFAGDDGARWLRFISPLRLERPTELVDDDGTYLDSRCFPCAHFLDRLWRRLFLLRFGRWPTEDEREEAMPPLPRETEADPAGLFWIDLPHPERRRTLGGALGRVPFRGVHEEWLPFLVLGRHLQAGASTNFAFGRFVIADDLGPLETPARRLFDQLGERERLDRALDHVAEQSVAAVTPARFHDERATRIPALLRRPTPRLGGVLAPVSPLLANLYLDELDDDVLGEDFRLVRYADDFVVLCRDVETAERARDTVEASLADLGLELNEEKTAVRSLDEGMSYLGYLFCRSLVLEPLRDEESEFPVFAPVDLDVPPRSWLAQVPLDRIRAVLDERAAGRRKPRVEVVPIGRDLRR